MTSTTVPEKRPRQFQCPAEYPLFIALSAVWLAYERGVIAQGRYKAGNVDFWFSSRSAAIPTVAP